MPYIYKIINNINGKIYIGKTNFTIENVGKNIVRILRKKVYKNVRYILL